MEYIGYLNPANDEDYQFIYASQLYGTFFCIYARFNENKSLPLPSCNSGEIPISNISFQIVNYKGSVNLGITHVNHRPLMIADGIAIKIEVQAMNGQIVYPYENISHCFKIDDQILIEREIKTLNPSDANADSIPLQDLNQIFDTEEWERNGLILPIQRNDKHEKSPKPEAPGKSCVEALFKVM